MIAAAGAAMLSEAWREHEQGGFTIRNGHIASIEQINDGFQRARHYYPDSPIDPHEDLRHRFYDYPAPDPSPPPSPTPVPIQQGGPSQQGGPGPGRATIGAGVAPGVQATPPPEAQNLPVRQSGDPTDCVLVGPNGQTEELSSKSGKHYTGAGVAAGVKGWPGFVNPDNGNPLGPDSTNSHCEAEAIATMITNGWTSGQLWINNSPCKPGERFSCATLMDTRLGSGRKLDIFVSDNLSCGDNLWRPWPFDGGC